MSEKNTIFDYLDWRGDLTFLQSEFNEIDALIFSVLSYLNFSCLNDTNILSLKEAIEQIELLPDDLKYEGMRLIMPSVVELGKKSALTNRFCDIKVCNFMDIIDEEREIQFAAVTFLLPDQTAFIAFRGTDNTLIGWKEDFNMSFTNGVPAQLEAAIYAEKIASQINIPFRIGGHSKGGNLAIWAGAHLSPQYKSNLIQIYNHDGPGFNQAFLNSDSYLEIRNKIISFVPESSIVGVLMAHDEYTIIKSSNPAFLQHDPFSWLLLGTRFLYDSKRSNSSKQLEKLINSWMESLTIEEREAFVDNVYEILTSSNAKTLDDLDKKKLRSLFHMQKAFREMSEKKQSQLLSIFNKLILK